MNATDFIKQHGVEKARKVVSGAPDWAMSINFNNGMYYSRVEHKKGDTFLYDIKRLVESVGLVEQFGNNIVGAKRLLAFTKDCKTIELSGSVITTERLKQAIADYESIYSIPESVRQAILNLEMHL